MGAVVVSLSKYRKVEIKRKKQKWIQIQSKYHHNHYLGQSSSIFYQNFIYFSFTKG